MPDSSPDVGIYLIHNTDKNLSSYRAYDLAGRDTEQHHGLVDDSYEKIDVTYVAG